MRFCRSYIWRCRFVNRLKSIVLCAMALAFFAPKFRLTC